mmetsp:Transcript_23282/g.34481  ORF Transcript_23282/g.34481 Transcript_23282/m.34481 type:complete len:213 (-) Transcript_23282:487-1125(-)
MQPKFSIFHSSIPRSMMRTTHGTETWTNPKPITRCCASRPPTSSSSWTTFSERSCSRLRTRDSGTTPLCSSRLTMEAPSIPTPPTTTGLFGVPSSQRSRVDGECLSSFLADGSTNMEGPIATTSWSTIGRRRFSVWLGVTDPSFSVTKQDLWQHIQSCRQPPGPSCEGHEHCSTCSKRFVLNQHRSKKVARRSTPAQGETSLCTSLGPRLTD